MSMRIKAGSIIMAVVFAFTAASLILSLSFTQTHMTQIMEQELTLALEIADTLVSTKISLLKSNAEVVAARLEAASDAEMTGIMAAQMEEFGDFISLAVYDRAGTVADFGEPIRHDVFFLESDYMQPAFNGESLLSSAHYNGENGRFIIHIFVPIGPGRVLAATIPGMVFSEILSGYRLWQTGSIFIVNAEGTFIASYRDDLVLEQRNLIAEAETDADLDSAGQFYRKVISADSGSGNYMFDGLERLCVHKRVSGSVARWHIGVTAPLKESPLTNLQNGLTLSTLLLLVLGAVVSIFASGVVAKPFLTIQRQAAQIKNENEQTMHILDAMPYSCSLWDSDSNLFQCNEETTRMFDLSNKQEYIDDFHDFSPEYQPDGQVSADAAVANVKKVLKEGKYVFEWMHKKKDGTLIPTEVTLVRIVHNDEHNVARFAVAAYVRDLREYKKMMIDLHNTSMELEKACNEATRANDAKSSFLANMSHEMRTPLNAVIGLSDLILGDRRPQENCNAHMMNIEKINKAGMVLLSTVNDILDISKIEAGKFELVPTIYEMPSLINDIVTQSIMHKGEKPIDFILDINEDLLSRLYGDELRIKQVLNNILSNAFKYTKEGTVELSIHCEREGDAVFATASVKDTGIGIRPEYIGSIFDDYSQMDMQANRKIIGTGLGLSIAKRLVELMNGSISVESEYGKGSVFTVRFPQTFVSDSTIGPEVVNSLKNLRYSEHKRNQNASLIRIRLPYARVLIVDDVVTNLDIARGLMKPYGMQIDCVTSGQQAIDSVREEKFRYNAIFMDHMMPGMDGVEATRIIREIGSDYAKTVPIIALTANAVIGNEKMFMDNGFQAFISKPIEISRLDSVIRQWVRDRSAEKAEAGDDGENNYAPDSKPDFFEPAIDGIDLEKGLERFGGDKGIYLNALHSYVTNIPPLLEIIRDATYENLDDYGTTVHGVKGTSWSICANDTGDRAEALERAAAANDFDFISANNQDFIESVEKLISGLGKLIGKTDAENVRPKKDMPDADLLASLLEACKKYDMDKVDAFIGELERYKYTADGGLAAWLQENAEETNFIQIVEKLSDLEKGGGVNIGMHTL